MSASSPLIVGAVARPLVGKCAIVTGASRGIGAAIAKAFAAAGADVAISYAQSDDKAQEVVKSIEAAGQRGFAIKADHANQDEVAAFVAESIKKLGKLDILVNNAGVFAGHVTTDPACNTPAAVADLNRMWAINVLSVGTAVRCAAPYLTKGGRIISIGSRLGEQVASPGSADYAATKSALRALTKGYARDFGSKGVTVNLVQPGCTDTDMNPKDGPDSALTKTIPAGRHGTVDEVAAVVLFVASPAASYCTGSFFTVDGGLNC